MNIFTRLFFTRFFLPDLIANNVNISDMRCSNPLKEYKRDFVSKNPELCKLWLNSVKDYKNILKELKKMKKKSFTVCFFPCIDDKIFHHNFHQIFTRYSTFRSKRTEIVFLPLWSDSLGSPQQNRSPGVISGNSLPSM